MIGKSVPRVDAYEKVTGRAKFTDDLILNKCLVARVYHAKIGNGVVRSIDTSEAEALDGVVKVVTFKDVPNHCYPTQDIPGPWSLLIRMWQTVICSPDEYGIMAMILQL